MEVVQLNARKEFVVMLTDAIANFRMDSLEKQITALLEGIAARDQLKL
jgi:hypothetical protein